MKIYYRQKILKNITNYKDLEDFFKEYKIFKFFKCIPKEFVNDVDNKINSEEKINFKLVKPWYRGIVNYPETIYNVEFLTKMGWDINETESFIKLKQKENSNILSKKKKECPEKYYDKNNKRKEYWMKKGFSEEESLDKISKIQKTFSKDICIEKYGLKKGLEIFNKRQEKWIRSLNSNPNLNEIRKKQNSYNYFEKNHQNLIDRTSFLEDTKKIISESIKEDDVENYVKYVLNEIDIKTLSDVAPYINSKIVQNKYSIDIKNLKKLFYDNLGNTIETGIYGTPVYYNGIRFKSLKEYKLALFFEKNNINYQYEKKYPNGKYFSDFYLPEFDVYVEYYGILDNKNLDRLDEKQEIYFKKMNEKNLFCNKHNLVLIQDTNFNKLIEKLTKII